MLEGQGQPSATRCRARSGRLRERWRELIGRAERTRDALCEVEAQRDDAVTYLSTIRVLLCTLAEDAGPEGLAQQIAAAIVENLGVETCAVIIRDRATAPLRLAGVASQGERLGSPGSGPDEQQWLALAERAAGAEEAVGCTRAGDGQWNIAPLGEVRGEVFVALPLTVAGERAGFLVLHHLAKPAQDFARTRALALLADIVGRVLTIADMRRSLARVCTELEEEVGLTRQALSAQAESLRAKEESITALTRQLIRSNRIKREFLGIVSHELRTPINAILGYSALLRDGMIGTISEDQAEALDRVLSNTRHLNQLIDDMLFFIHAESDAVAVRPEPVLLAELVEEAIESLPGRLGQSEPELRVEISPDAALVDSDRALLRRVLFHLLGNAFKFTSRGEVVVSARAAGRGQLLLSVRDTGVGIPPGKAREIFDLFCQVDASTTRRFSGLGMGLALVKRCVALLGGEITVESKEGVGSEFRVRLPHVRPRPASACGEPPAGNVAAAGSC